MLNTLYNDCWYGFWVRFWWPRVLWQAVTLWLVSRGWQCVGVGRLSRCVTWKRPRDMRTTRSDLDRVQSKSSRARDTQPIRGIMVVSDDTAWKAVQALAPTGSWKKIWGKKKSPLWVYVSPSISQTYNKLCAPFENKMRYIFIKKCVSFR